MVYWRICEARFETGSVVDITRAHLSQRKIVQHMGASVSPTSVRETDGSERWIITCFLCAKVNCDTADFRKVGVIWIVWETFVIIFSVKNIYIQFVKRSGNNAAICLARLFVFQPGCIVSWGLVLAEVQLF